jgi:nucleotide-binding universal stress UspA family protein
LQPSTDGVPRAGTRRLIPMHRRSGTNGTILCGVDGSDAGRAAAHAASAIAGRLGLRLVLAHAVDLPQRVVGRAHLRQLRLAAERLLALTAEELCVEKIEFRVELGDAAELLAWVAAEEDADLIVIGSRAAGLLRRRLECASASDLRRQTPVPVLIALPQTRPGALLRERCEPASAFL